MRDNRAKKRRRRRETRPGTPEHEYELGLFFFQVKHRVMVSGARLPAIPPQSHRLLQLLGFGQVT